MFYFVNIFFGNNFFFPTFFSIIIIIIILLLLVQVNLSKGVLADCINETCTAGAGSLLLEFGVLSRLLADPVYDFYAQQAVKMLWKYRSNVTGLLGKS